MRWQRDVVREGFESVGDFFLFFGLRGDDTPLFFLVRSGCFQ